MSNIPERRVYTSQAGCYAVALALLILGVLVILFVPRQQPQPCCCQKAATMEPTTWKELPAQIPSDVVKRFESIAQLPRAQFEKLEPEIARPEYALDSAFETDPMVLNAVDWSVNSLTVAFPDPVPQGQVVSVPEPSQAWVYLLLGSGVTVAGKYRQKRNG